MQNSLPSGFFHHDQLIARAHRDGAERGQTADLVRDGPARAQVEVDAVSSRSSFPALG